jgi:hypothetical protein
VISRNKSKVGARESRQWACLQIISVVYAELDKPHVNFLLFTLRRQLLNDYTILNDTILNYYKISIVLL